MFTRFTSFFLVILSCTWFAGCSSPTGPAPRAPTAQSNAAPASDGEMPFPKLEQGMTANAIREKLGNPAQIQPVTSPEGKAEIWVYKFVKSLGMTQVAAGTRESPQMSVGAGGAGMITVQEPIYTLAEKKSEVTLSLLMFNGRLQSQKALVENTLEHHG